MGKLTDAQLVDLANKGDDKAITTLMERYKSKVALVCRPYYLVGADTDDLIQEGMIAIFNAIKTYDENKKASFSSYAQVCVRNRIKTLTMRYNNKKNMPLNNSLSLYSKDVVDGYESGLVIDGIFSPEDSCINEEKDVELNNKIKSILSRFELKVLTYYLNGDSYQKIAENTGKKLKSIDNAIQRIRNKLSPILRWKENYGVFSII